jgi:O-methyltransferase
MLRSLLAKSIVRLRRTIGSKVGSAVNADMEPSFLALYERCSPFTMTSIERMYALYKAVEYVDAAGVAGDVVQCGVWRGGGAMLIALALIARGAADRELWLYDTYEGMSEPDERDVSFDGERASDLWRAAGRPTHNAMCYASIEEVRSNVESTGYPSTLVRYVKGKVEQTLPGTAPDSISLLHLDTDWYESTRHELVHLYPRLVRGGVLYVDDYGHWKGARAATDGYFADNAVAMLLNRVDYTGRIGLKL